MNSTTTPVITEEPDTTQSIIITASIIAIFAVISIIISTCLYYCCKNKNKTYHVQRNISTPSHIYRDHNTGSLIINKTPVWTYSKEYSEGKEKLEGNKDQHPYSYHIIKHITII